MDKINIKTHLVMDYVVQDGWYITMTESQHAFFVNVWKKHGTVKYIQTLFKSNDINIDDASAVFNYECDKIRHECYLDF